MCAKSSRGSSSKEVAILTWLSQPTRVWAKQVHVAGARYKQRHATIGPGLGQSIWMNMQLCYHWPIKMSIECHTRIFLSIRNHYTQCKIVLEYIWVTTMKLFSMICHTTKISETDVVFSRIWILFLSFSTVVSVIIMFIMWIGGWTTSRLESKSSNQLLRQVVFHAKSSQWLNEWMWNYLAFTTAII